MSLFFFSSFTPCCFKITKLFGGKISFFWGKFLSSLQAKWGSPVTFTGRIDDTIWKKDITKIPLGLSPEKDITAFFSLGKSDEWWLYAFHFKFWSKWMALFKSEITSCICQEKLRKDNLLRSRFFLESIDCAQVIKCVIKALSFSPLAESDGQRGKSKKLWTYFTQRQGCIIRSILPSGMGARGVSSEHVENMEMFSCSPT